MSACGECHNCRSGGHCTEPKGSEVRQQDLRLSAGPFSIGSSIWPGVGKLSEEAGEVLQVIGKLIGTGGSEQHWDGSNLRERLQEEIADVAAAIRFVAIVNRLDRNAIDQRMEKKLNLFWKWHEETR